ncbi:MAG: hypothetical protein MUD12_16915 [Spirochaetes bacterium]|jgi:hypothetical protein|nr:hypothetical protein [Spirochaetota bacterium]
MQQHFKSYYPGISPENMVPVTQKIAAAMQMIFMERSSSQEKSPRAEALEIQSVPWADTGKE